MYLIQWNYYFSYICLKGGYIDEALPVPDLLVPDLLVPDLLVPDLIILSGEVETDSFDWFVRLNITGLALFGTDGLVLLDTNGLVLLGIGGLVLLNTDGLNAEISGNSGSGLNKI